MPVIRTALILGVGATFVLSTPPLRAQTTAEATPPDQLLLKDYRPRSIFNVPQTRVEKARFPVIDVHSHQYAKTPAQVEQWVRNMDDVGIAKVVILASAPGQAFDDAVALFKAYPERFELGQVIDEAVAKARDAVSATGNRLIVDCTDRGTVMETDLSKLRQAMANLLDNAGKFTRNGTVSLIGRVKDGMAEITIRDTGVGISRENLPNLFQNFGEAEGATSSKYGGTGLGLALSQKLCRLMSGEISVVSELGVGSAFTLRVPVLFQSPPREADAAAPALDGAAAAEAAE